MAEGDEADETPAGAFIVAFVFICLFRCMFCPRFVKHRKMEPCGRDAPLLWRCLMYGGCEAPDHPTPSTVTGERQAVCATVAEVQFDEPGPLGVQLQSRAAPSPSQSLSTEVLGAVAGSQVRPQHRLVSSRFGPRVGTPGTVACFDDVFCAQAAAKNLTVGWLVQEINGADVSTQAIPTTT